MHKVLRVENGYSAHVPRTLGGSDVQTMQERYICCLNTKDRDAGITERLGFGSSVLESQGGQDSCVSDGSSRISGRCWIASYSSGLLVIWKRVLGHFVCCLVSSCATSSRPVVELLSVRALTGKRLREIDSLLA